MNIGAVMAFNHVMSPQFMADAAQMVENAGFHSVWLPEHVLFFPDYESRYPYTEDGRIPGDPEGVLDPFTALTWIAAATKRIRLGTGICLVPQRQPVYTAKMVADLDYLSGGRVDFGIGIGWLKEEFDNLQMDFRARARRCLEYVEVMQALWSPGLSSYEGETVTLKPCHFNPKPVQQPHPPIFFGGESDPALARVVSHGQGWYGFNLSPEGLAGRKARLAEIAAEAGRDMNDVRIFIGPSGKPVTPETVSEYEDLGVEQLIVPVIAGNLERLAQRIDKARAMTGL
ncbi:MAG TPA: LLM class F420-dependent oxidoreductase [Pseudomonadales bacterium]|jgi:probable F420-dependent oxidoreductase